MIDKKVILYKKVFIFLHVKFFMINLETIWQQFLVLAVQEVGSRAVETWFKALTLSHWQSEGKTVYLQAPNGFVRDWVQNRYLSIIELHLARMFHVASLKVVIRLEAEQESTTSLLAKEAIIPAIKFPTKKSLKIDKMGYNFLKAEYTFDTFVVGPNNSLSYAAAFAVTQSPGKKYNPLFIYGNSGVGKTHLLHAIGNELKKSKPMLTVIYQSADRFVTEFIHAIRFENIHKFQQKYHLVDVLLIDDIQCIANKEQTQEAFFNIFNVLYDSHKQIIFSSDTYPQKLAGVTERLRSRMAWGLVTDMYVPTLETKVAILKNKASNVHNIYLEDEVAECIASSVTLNVRELEGALIRVIASASFIQKPITIDLAKSVLKVQDTVFVKPTVSFHTIINAIHKVYQCDVQELCAKGRNKDIAHARQVAMFLMKKMTSKSLRDIGAFLGDRDHATIKHGVEKIEQRLLSNDCLQKEIVTIEALLQQESG
jgi:chromosomal replication initiator protein